MLRGIRKQISLADRSMLWLKELYIQLYYESGGSEPLATDAIRVSRSKKKFLKATNNQDKTLNKIRKKNTRISFGNLKVMGKVLLWGCLHIVRIHSA